MYSRAVLTTSLRLPEPFTTVLGDELPEIDVKWEQWGDPTLPASRTVRVADGACTSLCDRAV